MKSPAIVRFLDRLALGNFRMTVTEAHRLGCCVRCRRDVNPREYDVTDQNEYYLSALCPVCYVALTSEDGCE